MKEKIKLMKNRSSLTIFATILGVLACFGLAFGAQDSPGVKAQNSLALPLTALNGGNTADGARALGHLTTGSFNSAFGWFSLFSLTNAVGDTGLGAGALALDNGGTNTAVGAGALLLNTMGFDNNAVGFFALESNVDGNFNNAHGRDALTALVGPGTFFSGEDNNAFGDLALDTLVDGYGNTGIGDFAGDSLVTGEKNTFVGADIHPGDGGSHNTVVGYGAAVIDAGSFNTVVGDGAGTGILGEFNETFIGAGAGTNTAVLSDNIYIGAGEPNVNFSESNTIRIGDMNTPSPATTCFIGGILGNGPFSGIVEIDPASGQLGVFSSSARFKKDIEPMGEASEAIYSLKPVTFHYKNDKANTPWFGLIAEEVAKVNPALIGLDKEGKPYTVVYDKVNAMLLNEFLKEHKKVEEQQATISELKNEVQTVVAQLKEQAAQIQKVSAQLQVSKPAPQLVTNKP